jgi:hypothetical protein
MRLVVRRNSVEMLTLRPRVPWCQGWLFRSDSGLLDLPVTHDPWAHTHGEAWQEPEAMRTAAGVAAVGDVIGLLLDTVTASLAVYKNAKLVHPATNPAVVVAYHLYFTAACMAGG